MSAKHSSQEQQPIRLEGTISPATSDHRNMLQSTISLARLERCVYSHTLSFIHPQILTWNYASEMLQIRFQNDSQSARIDGVVLDRSWKQIYSRLHTCPCCCRTITTMHLQMSCMPRAMPAALSTPFNRGAHCVGVPSALDRLLPSPLACVRSRAKGLSVSAIASAQPSTVKIITQGRHVDVTDSLKDYVVRL